MTFPTIPTVAAGRVLFTNQADTSGTRTFPSLSSLTKNSGDLLIAIIATYESTTNPQFTGWGGGFTEFSDQGTSTTLGLGMAYKWSDGTETGTFDVTQAATITGHASMCLLSIPGAHASTVPEAGTIANDTAAAANPGSFNPAGWGTEDTLWIAVDANGMTNAGGSWSGCGAGAPLNYTDHANSNTTDSSTVGQTEVAVAFRQSAAASEDRGGINHDLSNARNSALIIAVRPNLNQTLTQSARFNNSNTFYTPTVTRGAVTVTQSSRFDSSNTFYSATVSQSGPQTLTQSARFDNSNTFHAPTVTRGAVTVTQSSRFDNSNTFYTPTVTRGAVTVTQSSRFDSSNTFYTPTVTRGAVTVTQSSRFDNSNTFYTPTVTRGAVTVTQSSRFDSSNTFYTPTVTRGAVTVTQSSRFDNSNTFYSATVSQAGPQTLTQSSRFDNSNTFYTLTITTVAPVFSGGNTRIGIDADGIDDGRIGLGSLRAHNGRAGATTLRAQKGRIAP